MDFLTNIKIPTVLGLGVLLAGVVTATLLVGQNQIFKSQAGTSSLPKNLLLTNLASTSATIIWQTDQAVAGFITAGSTSSASDFTFRDERDSTQPQKHYLHSVKLTNLQPDTTYYYKVNSGGILTASDKFIFKTPSLSQKPNTPPLIGSVLTQNLSPVDEALVVLKLPGSQTLSAVTKLSGNFILPLTEIRDESLSSTFDLSEPKVGTLEVYNNQLKSNITITIPQDKPIPTPIILGQNQDLSPSPTPTPNPLSKYDLNHDGVINSLDLSIILKNIKQKNPDPIADITGDGVVDQKDVDAFKSATVTP